MPVVIARFLGQTLSEVGYVSQTSKGYLGFPTRERGRQDGGTMSDGLWFIGLFTAYLVLMRWVLPRLGIPT